MKNGMSIQRYRLVWRSLRARTMSYPADIPLCIAILLDVDIRELLSVSVDDRTRKLWSIFPAIAGNLCVPCLKTRKQQSSLGCGVHGSLRCSCIHRPSALSLNSGVPEAGHQNNIISPPTFRHKRLFPLLFLLRRECNFLLKHVPIRSLRSLSTSTITYPLHIPCLKAIIKPQTRKAATLCRSTSISVNQGLVLVILIYGNRLRSVAEIRKRTKLILFHQLNQSIKCRV